MPSVCTMRRASISDRISASRRPSLVVSIHMAIAEFVELIGDVWVNLYECLGNQYACGGDVFRESCCLHGSAFSTHGWSLRGRVPPDWSSAGCAGNALVELCWSQFGAAVRYVYRVATRPIGQTDRCRYAKRVETGCRPAEPAGAVCRVRSSHSLDVLLAPHRQR
jgi:hypothetical protein